MILIPYRCDKVIDIGCGSGNVTNLLAKALQAKQVIAFDIDTGMVDFARKFNGLSNVRYEAASLSLKWEQLNNVLNTKTASNDLAIAVHCLQWVPEEDRQQAVDNISRLLRTGGRFYGCLDLWCEIIVEVREMAKDKKWRQSFNAYNNDFNLPEEDFPLRFEKEKPDLKEMAFGWKSLFEKSGLRILTCRASETEFDCPDLLALQSELIDSLIACLQCITVSQLTVFSFNL